MGNKFISFSEIVEANKRLGYFFVAYYNGYEIYKSKNEAGFWVYYSNENSNEGFLPIFDEAIMSQKAFIEIAKDCYNLELKPTNNENPV